MEAIYHAFQHWMLCACLAGLGMIAALVFLAKVAAPAWDALRRWWSLPCIQRVIVGVCVVGLSYYGATKQGWHVGYDGGIKAGATANVVTNDTVSIHWQRDTSGGVYVPESAAVYIDYRPNTETNAEWGLLAQTTVGAWGWSGTVQNATNYDYNVWAYYIPPEPVHTNGVWTYKTHFDRNGEYALPLRARVEVNGVAIATPAAKRRDAVPTARDYIQDGLIAMWDGIENAGWGIHDPNATTWIDLIGGLIASSIDPSQVGADFMLSDGIHRCYLPSLPSMEKFTIEMVVSDIKRKVSWSSVWAASNDNNSIGWPNTSSTTINWKYFSNRPGVSFDGGTLTALADGTTSGRLIVNGQSSSSSVSGSHLSWGTSSLQWSNPWGNNRGTLRNHCIRIYSRVLTPEEIQHNNKIDKERFDLP